MGFLIYEPLVTIKLTQSWLLILVTDRSITSTTLLNQLHLSQTQVLLIYDLYVFGAALLLENPHHTHVHGLAPQQCSSSEDR